MKHLRKLKLLFVAIALFSYSHICHADDTGDESVILWYTNGEKTCYLLSDKPVITYSGENVVLTATDVDIEVPMDDIERITIDKQTTGIKPDVSGQPQGHIAVNSDGAQLSGFEKGMKVYLYQVNGVLISQYTIPESGSLNISLNGMERGIYIIKAGRSTIKIARK